MTRSVLPPPGVPAAERPEDAVRVAALRERVLDRKARGLAGWSQRQPVTDARSLRASEGAASWQVRRGLQVRDRLADLRLGLDDLELLAGRVLPTGDDPEAVRAAQEYLAAYPGAGGQTGHCELELAPLLERGIEGLAARVRQRLDGATPETADVCVSFLRALEGLSLLMEHAADEAETAAAGAPAWRRTELAELAASCRRLAGGPPATFRDGLQLVWLAIMATMHADQVGLVVPGHLDRSLGALYAADRAAGRLTRDQALLLLECLYLLINDYIPDGLAIGVMVGGRDRDGADVTNEVSSLCLEALRRTRLVYPTVGVCWHEGTPGELVDLAVDLVASGCANPGFFGDETIQRGLKGLGVPPHEACRYVNSTCVEITPSGASNVWVASPYYNTCGLLLEEIAAQAARAAGPGAATPPAGAGRDAAAEDGETPPAPTFEAFLAGYRERLAAAVAAGVAEQNQARRDRRERGRKPLQSVLTRDCLARARDLDDGGATYNWAECSFVGLANLADSLHVIREVVYGGELTFAALKALLDTDFAGREDVRLRFLNGYPKYGQGRAEVDALVAGTVDFAVEVCRRFRMEPDGAAYVPGAFVWIMHERLGRDTGATPDGRRAGFPFADGCGPAQGREQAGPTAAILSTTSWDHSRMIGGLAYNMKFNTSLFATRRGHNGLRNLVLTFLRRGGFETQINVVDAETLRRVRQHPEQHRDLVVRVGGYTDYFTRLPAEMQDEVMLRTEYGDV
ncbi:MAG: pyruvate formate lyase family protein [Gemmatimonadota bacterium]